MNRVSKINDINASIDLKDEEHEESELLKTLRQCKGLLTNKAYVCCVLSISVLFFCISGIQYWGSDYFTEVLGVSLQNTHITFAAVCITAPIFGAIFSGYMGSKLGGYRGKYTLQSCILVGVFTVVCGFIIPMVDSFVYFAVLIWIMLFFGGYILPIMTGVMLTTVMTNEKN